MKVSSGIANALSALGGYAIASAQSWWKQRSEHRKQLRWLLNEVRRFSAYETEWPDPDAALPAGAKGPLAPTLTPTYLPLVSQIDFRLTDEHEDDNAQLTFLTLSDGCRRLEDINSAIFEKVAQPGPLEGEDREFAIGLIGEYNEVLGKFRESLKSARLDLDRRLRESRTLPQIRRLFTRPATKPGTNPRPIR